MAPSAPRRITIVGPGTIAVTTERSAMLHTGALGSGIAVALYEPDNSIGGMLHFLLPDSSLDSRYAARQPELFGDRGFELLLHQCERLGANRERLRAYLVGGADPLARNGSESEMTLGARNIAAARLAVSRASIQLVAERVGGIRARRLALELDHGRVHITETPTVKRPPEEPR